VARSDEHVQNPSAPSRREALRRLAAGAIGAAASPTWVQSLTALARTHAETHAAQSAMAAQAWTPTVFTAHQNDAVIALTELIIPATDTPGATAALVNRFIDRVLADAPSAQREAFLRGLAWIETTSRAEFGQDIAGAGVDRQTALFTRLADDGNHAPGDAPGVELFHAIKSMTISGYYSSEIGLRQELGDDGVMMTVEFHGCDHPEHQG
jgi:gluconate 2-dehydrogenase gamma chain